MGTKAGLEFFISNASVADTDLNQAGFEALTWVKVANVGSVPEFGNNEPIATYKGLDGVKKGKGLNDPGNGDVEMAHKKDDVGQIAMRAAGITDDNYAFKVTLKDGTVDYVRGVISGPRHPSGGDEDFNLEVYALGLEQHLRVVAA